MKRWMYAEYRDGRMEMTPLGGSGIPAGDGGFDAVLLSRLDFMFVVLPVPALSGDELRQVIRYRIRGVYPGNDEETVFDFELSGDRRTAAVAITKKETFEALRAAAGAARLCLPWQLLRPSAITHSREPRYVALFFSSWVEILLLENSFPAESRVIPRDTAGDVIGQLVTIVTRRGGKTPVTLIASAGELGHLRKDPGFGLLSGTEVSFIDLETLLSSPGTRNQVFSSRKKRGLPSFGVRMVVLLLLFTLSVIWSGMRRAEEREAVMKALGDRYAVLELEARKTAALTGEIEDLERRLALYGRELPPDMFGLFSALRGVLGEEVLLDSFSIRNRSFQCEGRAVNPFSLVERFAGQPDLFSSITIVRVSPLAGTDRESFVLTGSYHGR